MLKIKGQEDQGGRRFEYSDGVAFWIRPLTGGKLKELRKQCTKTRMEVNPRSRKMEPVEDIDEEKFEDLLADYILEKWEGVGDADGNPLELSLKSKKLIMDQLALREYIWGAAQSLDVAEAAIKNSLSSHGSTTPGASL